MSNQMKNAKSILATGAPLTDLRLGTSTAAALDGTTGEINAHNAQELAVKIGELLTASASGHIVDQSTLVTAEASEARREALTEAINDHTGVKWASLGSGLAREINEQASREGFLRRVAQGQTLKQGDVPRIPMPSHDAMAVVATSSSNVGFQTIRQRVFTPAEFEIVANVRVDNLDIEQVNGDLLEHAYNDGLQSIMTQEDRLWKDAADQTVGVVNPLELIAGELTTKALGNLRQAVAQWNLPATTAIISNDYWSDIIGSNDFATMLDPITKYDLALNGQLGTLVGMNLITDGFRAPNQRVLGNGEIYIVASPEHHAAYSTRGGIRSTPTSGADHGNSTRGWFMTNPFSFALANVRSVAKGKRI